MSRYYRQNPDEPIRHDWTTTKPPEKLLPQPAPSFENARTCIDCGEYAASGGPRCEDCEESHLND